MKIQVTSSDARLWHVRALDQTGKVHASITCHTAKQAYRGLTKLEKKYKKHGVIAIAPSGMEYSKPALRNLIGLPPIDPTARSRAGRLGAAALWGQQPQPKTQTP